MDNEIGHRNTLAVLDCGGCDTAFERCAGSPDFVPFTAASRFARCRTPRRWRVDGGATEKIPQTTEPAQVNFQ
jgi:hypothetical protein